MNTRRVLIVGGTRGIGHATARRLAESGLEVWTCGRSRPESNNDKNIKFFELDVLAPELVFDSLPERLDGLVYCPGTITLKPFPALKEADFRADWEINFLGAARCARALLPRLQQGEGPSIVFFSTVAVHQGMAFHASIAAAKGAVEALTRSLAAEFAPAIRVNCVAPSLTATDLSERLLATEQRRREAAARHPLQRYGAPGDVAAVVALLLTGETRWVTGQIFNIDGGLSTLRAG